MNSDIYSLLHEGAKNGTNLRELCRITQQDERAVRRLIRAERMAGKLILSDNKSGYFRPADHGEARRYIRSMNRRALEIAKAARAAEEALADLEGQTRLEWM